MGNKPKYIIDLETEMQHLKENYQANRESQDKMLEIQGSTLSKLTEIQICLAGTEFDKTDQNGKGGGLVRRVGRVEKRCSEIDRWKDKTEVKNYIVWGIITAAVGSLWAFVVKQFTG